MKKNIQLFLGIVLIVAAYAVAAIAVIVCMPFCLLWHIIATTYGFFQEARS